MEISKMDSVLKIYQKIKDLDDEIIGLEKIGLQLVNDSTEVCFDLKINNHTEKEKEDALQKKDEYSTENIFDQLMRGSMMTYSSYLNGANKTNSNEKVYSHKISVYTALSICGILLKDKQYKREELVNKLSEFGVKI